MPFVFRLGVLLSLLANPALASTCTDPNTGISATLSTDGYLRLYDAGAALIRAQANHHPSFSTSLPRLASAAMSACAASTSAMGST